MPLVSISWRVFKYHGLWDKFDLDCGKSRYRGMEDLPQKLLIEYSSVNLKFLKNKTGETVSSKLWLVFYLLLITTLWASFGELTLYIYLISIVNMRIVIYKVLVL